MQRGVDMLRTPNRVGSCAARRRRRRRRHAHRGRDASNMGRHGGAWWLVFPLVFKGTPLQ